MERPTRKAALQDLKLCDKEGLVADVKAVATSVTVTIRSWNSVLLEDETVLGFRRVNFCIRNFTEEFHGTCSTGKKDPREPTFNDHFIQAQDLCMMRKEFLPKLKHRQERKAGTGHLG